MLPQDAAESSRTQIGVGRGAGSRICSDIAAKPPAAVLRLGGAEADLVFGRVRAPDGGVTELRRQSADVLRLLVSRRGQTVTKADLLDGVWGDIAVTEDSLVQCIGDIRRALGAERAFLATVQRIGYRLRAEDEATASMQPRSGRPSVAVVGMADPDAEAAWGNVLTGFVEDLATDLAQRSEIRVIALGIGARLEIDADLPASARRIGTGYLLLCRLTECERRPRLVVQLLDGATAGTLWSGRYLLSPDAASDAARIRAAAVAGLIAGLDGEIVRAERARLRCVARTSKDPYELYALAGDGLETDDRHATLAGLALAERCTAVDPRFARGWLMVNWRRCRLFLHGWGDDAADRLRREAAVFRTAVALEPRDPVALGFLAVSLAKSGAISEARRLVDRAVEIAVDQPDAGAELAFPVSTIAGQPERALDLIERGLDCHPRPPVHWGYMEARAAFLARRYERAVAASDLCPDCLPKLVFRTLAQAELGEPESVATWRTLIDLVPNFDFGRYARDLPIADADALAVYAAAQVKLRGMLASSDAVPAST